MKYNIYLYKNDNGHPIEYIKKIDDNTVYVAYKTVYNDSEAYVYTVARKMYTAQEIPVVGYQELWLLGERYVISKTLSSADYASVEIGDSLESICAIEPVIEADLITNPMHMEQKATYRLLEDGVMKISFDRDTDTVSAIEFHPYGDIYSNDGTEVFNILRLETPAELPEHLK